jgi:hypothetical protein
VFLILGDSYETLTCQWTVKLKPSAFFMRWWFQNFSIWFYRSCGLDSFWLFGIYLLTLGVK